MVQNETGEGHASNGDGVAHVAICAATCRRPNGLRQLLLGLSRLDVPNDVHVDSVIIVDNDPDGSAKSIVDAIGEQFPFAIQYVHETTPGIPFARNAALDSVDDHVQWICFLDDDEVPRSNWLANLLAAQQQFDADVVAGPVVPEFDAEVPAWAVCSGFFHRKRHATGTILTHAFTNNVLFRAQLVSDMQLRFDERYAGRTGEDRDFFRRLAVAGGRIIWADNAVVVETIPANRATVSWLTRRMFYVSRAISEMERQLQPGPTTVFVLAAKAVTWICIGLITAPTGLLARRWAVRSLRWIAYGCGLLFGLFHSAPSSRG